MFRVSMMSQMEPPQFEVLQIRFLPRQRHQHSLPSSHLSLSPSSIHSIMGAKALLLALVVGCSVAFAGLVILDKAGRGPCAGVVAARALAGAAAKASGQASLNKIVPASICASAAPGSLDDKVQPCSQCCAGISIC